MTQTRLVLIQAYIKIFHVAESCQETYFVSGPFLPQKGTGPGQLALWLGVGDSLTQWCVINPQPLPWMEVQVNVITIHTLGPQGAKSD